MHLRGFLRRKGANAYAVLVEGPPRRIALGWTASSTSGRPRPLAGERRRGGRRARRWEPTLVHQAETTRSLLRHVHLTDHSASQKYFHIYVHTTCVLSSSDMSLVAFSSYHI